MTYYVLDITGFVDNNNGAIAKELAIMPITYNADPMTWFFKPPYEWANLNEGAKSYNEYLIYRDGLSWEAGETDYYSVKKVLDEHLQDVKTIFVKDFKVGEWLISYGFRNFYDISSAKCYINTYTIPIFDLSPCLKHTHTNVMACAAKNVKKLLFDVMVHYQ